MTDQFVLYYPETDRYYKRRHRDPFADSLSNATVYRTLSSAESEAVQLELQHLHGAGFGTGWIIHKVTLIDEGIVQSLNIDIMKIARERKRKNDKVINRFHQGFEGVEEDD